MFLQNVRHITRRNALSSVFAGIALVSLTAVAGCGGSSDDDLESFFRFLDFRTASYDSENDLYYNLFTFRGKSDKFVKIEAFSNDFNPVLGAEDNGGSFISEFDDPGDDTAKIEFDIDRDQEVFVAVGSGNGREGDYELKADKELELIDSRRVAASQLSPEFLAKLKAYRVAKKASAAKP